MFGVWLVMVALALWAAIDCSIRPSAAFPAIDRNSKVMWLAVTVAALAVQVFFGGMGLLGIISVVASVFYLVDVRAKIISITSGRN